MERNEILVTIRNLANTQGFYVKLYRAFANLKKTNPRNFDLIMSKLEAQNFNDATDLVLYFETL
jgi:hypothetical protein